MFRIISLILMLTFFYSCGTQRKTSAPAEQAIQKEVKKTTESAPEAVDAPVKPKEEFCARNTKMKGYRIQIYFSKDRKNWEPTEKSFRANHPGVDVLLKYSPPHYRILVGQYLTKKSAGLDFIKYKRDYPGSVIANWDIWCKQAK